MLLIISPLAAFADGGLQLLSKISIPFGTSEEKLGTLGPGGEDWKPLFFAILPDGNIAVPDYYKSRIAVYTPEGRFSKAITVDGIVSPRMNYFGVTGTGCYIAFNDSSLYCVSPEGEVAWNAPFPLGVLPSSIFAGADAVFFSVNDEAKGLIGASIPTEPPYAASPASVMLDDRAIPYIAFGARRFGYNLADTAAIRSQSGAPFNPDAASAGARLLATDGAGRSAWATRDGVTFRTYVLGEAGKPLFSGSLALSADSSWYWAVARFEEEAVSLYLCERSGENMEIDNYRVTLK